MLWSAGAFGSDVWPPSVPVCDGTVSASGANFVCSVSWRFVAADAVAATDVVVTCGGPWGYFGIASFTLDGGSRYYGQCNVDVASTRYAWGVASSLGGRGVIACRSSNIKSVLYSGTYRVGCGSSAQGDAGMSMINLAVFSPGLYGLEPVHVCSGGGAARLSRSRSCER